MFAGAVEIEFEGASVFAGGAAVFALASAAGKAVFALASVAAVFAFASAVFELAAGSVDVSGLLDRTETFPVSAGIDNISAEIINTHAAAIVTFERMVVVPRGANAELDTLLVNKAPASVLPGCSNTAATSIRQDRKKIP